MESCNICCFPYHENGHVRKDLDCKHSLCKSCYLRLDQTHCPFCRSTFKYTNQELQERESLNLTYHNWQPPSQISNYIPPNIIRNRHRERILPTIDLNTQQQVDIDTIPEPFSRAKRNMTRKNRRDLDFKEVLERRKIIKKRSQKKWNRKNTRAEKELGFFTAGMCIY